MKNFLLQITRSASRLLSLSAVLILLGIGNSSCTDTPSPVPEFTIDGISPETEYLITNDRTIWLAGSGFQTGDVIRLTDTGLSRHSYRIEPTLTDTGVSFILTHNFVAGEYAIFILRGNRVFQYGQARFSREMIPDREGMNVKGSVRDTNGIPIADVVVSDGIEIALTDEKGRFWLATQRQNPHLFVTLPSNYMPQEQKGQFTAFYKPIPQTTDPNGCVEINFTLTPVSNDNFELIVITDTHLTVPAVAQASMLFTTYCIPDINAYISQVRASGHPAYLVNLGDLTAAHLRNYCTLEDAAEMLKKVDCPIFNVTGNHELNDGQDYLESDEGLTTEIRRYQATMGPLYYSVNLGKAHLIVLNPCNRIPDGAHIEYYISGQQLAWLRKDLALVKDKTAPLLLAIHHPVFSANAYGVPSLPGATDLIGCFSEFTNIHILSGHLHKTYTTVAGNGRITEHTYGCLGGTSGHWTTWRLSSLLAERHQAINTDGSPASYGTLTIEGSRITDYCVKGVNLPHTKRFRAYDRNTIHLTAANYLPKNLAESVRGEKFNAAMGSYTAPSSENEILVKIWEYNHEWDVKILEGGKPLTVTEILDRDPLYLLCYDIPSYATMDEPSYPGSPRRLFSAKAASATSTITIRITDSFGHVTEETMTRPKAFVSSFD